MSLAFKTWTLDATLFPDYLQDVLILEIEEFREATGMPIEPAIFSMDNCSAHTSPAVIQLLSDCQVKAIVFLPHASGIVRILDLVFFGVFKCVKLHFERAR
jgi:hypothetical protein